MGHEMNDFIDKINNMFDKLYQYRNLMKFLLPQHANDPKLLDRYQEALTIAKESKTILEAWANGKLVYKEKQENQEKQEKQVPAVEAGNPAA